MRRSRGLVTDEGSKYRRSRAYTEESAAESPEGLRQRRRVLFMGRFASPQATDFNQQRSMAMVKRSVVSQLSNTIEQEIDESSFVKAKVEEEALKLSRSRLPGSFKSRVDHFHARLSKITNQHCDQQERFLQMQRKIRNLVDLRKEQESSKVPKWMAKEVSMKETTYNQRFRERLQSIYHEKYGQQSSTAGHLRSLKHGRESRISHLCSNPESHH